MQRPRILLFSSWFEPGFKGGGSQLAIVNLVHALRDEFEFWIITRDRDLGDSRPYADVLTNVWIENDQFHLRYQSPGRRGFFAISQVIQSTPHDLMHLNSVVSIPFGMTPLIFRKFQSFETPVLISPHGEMSPHARAQKPLRKLVYLKTAIASGLFSDASWHASSSLEALDIKNVFGPRAHVTVAPILPPGNLAASAFANPKKAGGVLRCVFLSRIDRMKNLDLAIDLISATPNTTLDIYGPIGQPDYWSHCMSRIAVSKYPDAFKYKGSVAPDQVATTLSQYDLLVQPSQSENFGYTILEALCAGCPVLISDQTPWRALESAGIGFDFPLSDPERFRRALMQMRDMDEPAHFSWRRRARDYAKRYIQTSPAKEATREMYTAALSRK